MLENIIQNQLIEKKTLDSDLKAAQEKLASYQLPIKEAKIPVVVVLEGWQGAGKGSALRSVIKELDPRFFNLSVMENEPTEEESRKPYLYRYFIEIPEGGKFQFFDNSCMSQITKDVLQGKISKKEYRDLVDDVIQMDRQLTDSGYLLIKFFFHVDQATQKSRQDALLANKDTAWRVDEYDLWENKHYEECKEVYNQYLIDTNRPNAPWYIIDASKRKWAVLQILRYVNQAIETGLENKARAVPILQNTFPLMHTPLLQDIPLDVEYDISKYKDDLKSLQARLTKLQNKIYRKKIPVILVYEGWDAAGKGGNIRRLSAALDPRWYDVVPIASPEPHEKARHFLWRFWEHLPEEGYIQIFDRSWYGRVMVERLEGFCTENEWKRAYNEINEFEKMLNDWGAVIIKFWVQIDKDTQLERFQARQNTPEKRWKITDEDWRNREKWDDYEVAVNEMIQKTSTTFAPWYILESVDKKYARVKALQIVVDKLEEACHKKDEADLKKHDKAEKKDSKH